MRHIFCFLFLLFTATSFAASSNWAPTSHKSEPAFQVEKANLSAFGSHLFFHVKAVSEITAEEEVKSEKESEETVLEIFSSNLNPLFCQRKLVSAANFIAFSQGIPLFVVHHCWKTHLS